MGKSSPNVSIVGLGVTRQGRLPDVTPQDLQAESLRSAIDDAGLRPSDIDAYIYQPGVVDMGKFGSGGRIAKRLGIDADLIWSTQVGGLSAMSAICAAAGLIGSGAARNVAIGYGDTALSTRTLVGAAANGPQTPNTMGAYGMYSPGADHALAARRHMHLYGTTKEQLGVIAVTARMNANKRPDAYFHDRPLSMDDYLGARPIAEPLGKYDYCAMTDGGCTFIVTSAERAAHLNRGGGIDVLGVGFSHSIGEGFDRIQYSQSSISRSAKTALGTAGVAIDDVDVAQIYDCFTIEVLMAIEGVGLCGVGEGGPYLEDGNIGPDASIPINTGGGELSWGYMQGFTPIAEAVRQLRGEGAATQVTGAEISLVTAHGGTATGNGQMEYADGCMILRRGI